MTNTILSVLHASRDKGTVNIQNDYEEITI